MFELGKTQSLIIVKELDFGVYLGETLNASVDDRVLLPKKQVPKGSRIGDHMEVFLYKDSKDRLPDLIHCAAHDIILPIPAAPFQIAVHLHRGCKTAAANHRKL